MRTLSTIAELRHALALVRESGKTIGFVPTMGALHEGHRSLMQLSKQQADVTVVSIFVNPTQFGPNEDFAKYPRTLDSDIKVLIEDEVEFLFAPDAQEIYPHGNSTTIHVAGVTDLYEGAIRPGHFDGVATVVSILFNIVQPHFAYFGQKDAQQVAVIKRIVTDLHIPVQIVVGQTIREEHGLALSSRNRMLSQASYAASTSLHKVLQTVRESMIVGSSVDSAKKAGIEQFEHLSAGARLDYLDVVHAETFHPMTSFEPLTREELSVATIVIAARFGETRLIDNLRID